MRASRLIRLALTLALLLAIVACAGPGADLSTTTPLADDTPTNAPPPAATTAPVKPAATQPPASSNPSSGRLSLSQLDKRHFGAATASIEERIHASDVIVRASFLSAADGQLRFKAIEYLKGTGATEFSIHASTAGRDTQWDNREAILFLAIPDSPTRSSGSAKVFDFADTTSWDYAPGNHNYSKTYAGELPSGYTIASRNPVWLPAKSTAGSATKSPATSGFITAEDPGSTDAITLETLKAKIAWMTGGNGAQDYADCIIYSLGHDRTFRDWEAYHGQSWPLHYAGLTTASGGPNGTQVYRFDHTRIDSAYYNIWLSGDHAHLFSAQVVDDDEIASNGYQTNITTLRPIPSGTYTIIHRVQAPGFMPCNFVPTYNRVGFTVTVTHPSGTVHEALFDPVALTAGAGFSGSSGTLTPAGFTLGSTATSITGLTWANDSLVLTLDPFVSLSGNALDFIALDGTVALSLEASSATTDSTAGTLTWTIATQPWQAGDNLMLRIRASLGSWLEPDPEASPVGGHWREFTVRSAESAALTVNIIAGRGPNRSGKWAVWYPESNPTRPSVSEACRKTYSQEGISRRTGQTFSLVACEAGAGDAG